MLDTERGRETNVEDMRSITGSFYFI